MPDDRPTLPASRPRVPPGRTRLLLLAVAALVTVSACASTTSSTTASTASATTTAAAGTTPSGTGPVITSFQVIDDVTCSGSTVSVPVSWATRNAQTVKIEIDRQPLAAAPNQALSGVGSVSLPCDGQGHELVLVADGEGTQVAVARQVNTANATPPANAPAIGKFDVLDDVTCSGGTVEVPAAWLTTNAQAVNFSVDGQPLPAAAGFPTTGVGNIPVPCDGKPHKVTLTATGTGQVSLSRSVNTTTSSSGGGTTTPAPSSPTLLTGVTEAPPTTR